MCASAELYSHKTPPPLPLPTLKASRKYRPGQWQLKPGPNQWQLKWQQLKCVSWMVSWHTQPTFRPSALINPCTYPRHTLPTCQNVHSQHYPHPHSRNTPTPSAHTHTHMHSHHYPHPHPCPTYTPTPCPTHTHSHTHTHPHIHTRTHTHTHTTHTRA